MPAPSPALRVRFWGVRGSVPTPGPTTVRYGGNTSCVSVEFEDGHVLVLDAGTGIRELGDSLVGGEAQITVALTHGHWDHIQGFPFFGPLFEPGREITFVPHRRGRDLFDVLMQQIDGARFPVTQTELPSRLTFLPVTTLDARLDVADAARLRVNHPGETDAIRVRSGGRTLVFAPDNELDPPYAPLTSFAELTAFCHRADVLIHDAQYLDDDLPARSGWGHSTVRRTCELAAAAEVRHLVLFHHDPNRTDDALDAIQEQACETLAELGSDAACTVAFEGLVLDLPKVSDA